MGPTCRRAYAWEAEGWKAARQRVQEAKGDGSRGTGGPRLCMQQGAGAGCPLCYGWNQITLQAVWKLWVEPNNFTGWVRAAFGRLLGPDVRALASPIIFKGYCEKKTRRWSRGGRHADSNCYSIYALGLDTEGVS